MPNRTKKPTAFHWGSYYAEVEDGKIVGMKPYGQDRDPSNIAKGIIDSIDDELRVKVPHIRKGYLREIRKELANGKMAITGKRSREKRGSDDFVAVSWEEAIDIVSFELNRIKKKYKNKAFLRVLMVGVQQVGFIMHKANFIGFSIVTVDILNQSTPILMRQARQSCLM